MLNNRFISGLRYLMFANFDLQDLSCVVSLPSVTTATYCLVLDNKGEMFCGVGDMDITDKLTADLVGG